MKFYYIVLLTIIIASCSNDKSTNDLLIGNWKLDTVVDSSGIERDFYFFTKPGIEFISTSQFRYLPGPLNFTRDEQQTLKELTDTVLNFKIVKNQISFNSIKNNKTITKSLVSLSSDSLYLLDTSKNLHKYVRIYRDSINRKMVNRIVLSSSGCFGFCPIMDIEIDHSCEGSFYCTANCGDIGFHKGKLQKSKVKRLFNFLDFISIYTLQNSYSANHTDDETITMSFYKDNIHLKTISDYGRMAPTEFIWLYTYLRYMPGLKNLKRNLVDNNKLGKSRCYVLSNGKEGYSFDRSESYKIYAQLINAKEIDQNIDLQYEIYNLGFPIQKLERFIEFSGKPEAIGHTDGRYFKFKSLDNKTIDLGYNCLDYKEPI